MKIVENTLNQSYGSNVVELLKKVSSMDKNLQLRNIKFEKEKERKVEVEIFLKRNKSAFSVDEIYEMIFTIDLFDLNKIQKQKQEV